MAVWMAFGIEAKIRRPGDRCPSVEISSKTIVELLEYLGCGTVPRPSGFPNCDYAFSSLPVISFLQGLALDALYVVRPVASRSGASASNSPRPPSRRSKPFSTISGIVHGRGHKAQRRQR